MNILLLGATGRLGKEILKKLAHDQLPTTVVVRDASKVALSSEQVTVVEGNPSDPTVLAPLLATCTHVITTLNISRTSDFPWAPLRDPKTLLSDTMHELIRLAGENNLEKIVTVSAWGVLESKHDLPWWFRWTIDYSNIRFGYEDHARQEQLLTASSLPWTIIRPVGLTNAQKDKEAFTSTEGKTNGILVSRKSVAAFIVDRCLGSQYDQEIVTVS